MVSILSCLGGNGNTPFKNQWPDIPRRVLEAFALQAYRSGVITEYEVQKLLKISSRMQLDAFLKESNAYIDYTEKDLQQDIENIRKSLLK